MDFFHISSDIKKNGSSHVLQFLTLFQIKKKIFISHKIS
jgi:hypothetical protein